MTGVVKSALYVSKEDAQKLMLKHVGEDAFEILDGVNPLPSSIHVNLTSDYVNPDSANNFSYLISKGNEHIISEVAYNESQFLDYSSAKKRFDMINKHFPNETGLIHGGLDKEERDKVLKKFLKKEIHILVSTTVIEVGIDFPDANLIIIENANKFGLAQLHQLRGRVGRGTNQGICILLYKDALSKNSIKR